MFSLSKKRKKRVKNKLGYNFFKDTKKFKIQRYCRACGTKMIVNNANRYYCLKCRGY